MMVIDGCCYLSSVITEAGWLGRIMLISILRIKVENLHSIYSPVELSMP